MSVTNRANTEAVAPTIGPNVADYRRASEWGSMAIILMGFLVSVPLIWLLVAYLKPEWDPTVMAFTLHFWAVSVAALMAAGLAAVVIASARSLRHTQVLFVALGFLALAVIFSAHGLTTWPGKYGQAHDWSGTGISAWLSLAVVGADEIDQRLGQQKGLVWCVRMVRAHDQ